MEIVSLNNKGTNRGILKTDFYDSNLTTIAFNFKVGSYNENKDNLGIAHLVEHLVFRGTEKRNSTEINEYIESIGGYLNAYTSQENTKFYCTVPTEYIEEGIELLADICFHNTIPVDEFELEKNIVINELRMYEDDPQSVCQENLFRLMFHNAINRQLVGGIPKTVSKITREQVLDYISKNFISDNLTVIITGGLKENFDYNACLCRLIPAVTNDISTIQEFKFDIDKTLIKVNKEGIQQSQLMWGIIGPSRESEDSISFALIATYLGGNASSILYKEIREKLGYVYQISNWIEWFNEYSVLIGYASLNEQNIKKTMQFIYKAYKSLDNMNLEACKNYVIGEIYRQTETTSGNNDNYTYYNDDIEERIEKIKNITMQDIKKTFDKYFNQKIVFSIVTPTKIKGGGTFE